MGGVFQQQGLGNWVRVEEKLRIEYRDIFSENLVQSAQYLRLERLDHYNNLKHTAKTTQEWLRDNSVNVLRGPSQRPDLNPIEHLWRDLKMAIHHRSPASWTELERICRGKWQKIFKACHIIPKP